MTHLSSQNSLRQETDLTEVQVKQLMSVAGDHSASEADWVQACLILGDKKPELPKKRRNRKLALILGSIVLVSAASLWYRISMIENLETSANKGSDQFAVAPEVPVSPPVTPAPGIPDAFAPGHATASDAVEKPDYGRFMARMQRTIKRNWRPEKSDVSRRVKVLFKVNRTGAMSDLRVKDSSGVDTADAAALKAVEAAAPFPGLPAGGDDSVDIEFTFDYNVFQK